MIAHEVAMEILRRHERVEDAQASVTGSGAMLSDGTTATTSGTANVTVSGPVHVPKSPDLPAEQVRAVG